MDCTETHSSRDTSSLGRIVQEKTFGEASVGDRLFLLHQLIGKDRKQLIQILFIRCVNKNNWANIFVYLTRVYICIKSVKVPVSKMGMLVDGRRRRGNHVGSIMRLNTAAVRWVSSYADVFKGTQDWEFFCLRIWILHYLIVSCA